MLRSTEIGQSQSEEDCLTLLTRCTECVQSGASCRCIEVHCNKPGDRTVCKHGKDSKSSSSDRRPSVRSTARPFVRPSVRPPVRPFASAIEKSSFAYLEPRSGAMNSSVGLGIRRQNTPPPGSVRKISFCLRYFRHFGSRIKLASGHAKRKHAATCCSYRRNICDGFARFPVARF